MTDETTTKPASKLGGKSKIAMIGAGIALLIGGAIKFGLIDKEGATAAEVARETYKLSITLLCNLPEATRFGALEVAQTSMAEDGRGGLVACTPEEIAALGRDDGALVDAVVDEAATDHVADEAAAAVVVEEAVDKAEAAGVELPVDVPEPVVEEEAATANTEATDALKAAREAAIEAAGEVIDDATGGKQ